jgi:alkylhydroperoxidase family enzyme
VLAPAEEITQISSGGATDDTYNNALQLFGEVELAQAIMAITVINAWNRIAVSTHMAPALDERVP